MTSHTISRLALLAVGLSLATAGCTSEGQLIRVDLPPAHRAVVRAVGSAPSVTITNDGPGAVAVRMWAVGTNAAERPFVRLTKPGVQARRTFLGPAMVELFSSVDEETTVAVKIFSGTEVAVEEEPAPYSQDADTSQPASHGHSRH